MTDGPALRKVVAAVHGPVADGPPSAEGLHAYAVLRPHPTEPSPHPESVAAVVLAWFARADVPDPGTWFDAPVAAYLVDEHVRIAGAGRGPDEADGTGVRRGASSPYAVVQCSFVRRRPDLTRGEFATHWADVHAPLVPVHHPGVDRYVQNVVVAPLTDDAPEVDGIAQLCFRTLADFRERYYDSDAGRRLVGADVARFIDRPQGWRIHAQETWIPV